MDATSSFSASVGQQQFLNLLVTQLQNQDPLSPVAQEDFLAQLAQFSTVEQLEKMNTGFDSLLKLQLLSSGAELLGKTVTHGNNQSGVVQEVTQDSGQVLVRVGEHLIPLSDVGSIANTGSAATGTARQN